MNDNENDNDREDFYEWAGDVDAERVKKDFAGADVDDPTTDEQKDWLLNELDELMERAVKEEGIITPSALAGLLTYTEEAVSHHAQAATKALMEDDDVSFLSVSSEEELQKLMELLENAGYQSVDENDDDDLRGMFQ